MDSEPLPNKTGPTVFLPNSAIQLVGLPKGLIGSWLDGQQRAMNTTLSLVLLTFGIVAAILFIVRRKPVWPVGKPCSVCGAVAEYGYDEEAEDLANIKPLCWQCLVAQIEEDYAAFTGRAVIIQPAPGPPSYVFQPVKEWRDNFKDSKIADDVVSLLAYLDAQCHTCGQAARFLWIESSGLNSGNFSETLDLGISATLLRSNPAPLSLCATCCVGRIAKNLREKGITYGEVCSPKGTVDGFVVPMGY